MLILASQSPQRRTLLAGLGIPFAVVPSEIDEKAHPENDPALRARALSALKARDVARRKSGLWVLGSDTLVVAPDGTLLEKPENPDEARAMLQRQSGGTSLVHSGLTLVSPSGEEWSELSTSGVRFKTLTPREIDWWVRRGLWEGRSGGFQIDGLGQFLIEHIEGDWTGIVGLPVFLFGELLHKANAPFHPARAHSI